MNSVQFHSPIPSRRSVVLAASLALVMTAIAAPRVRACSCERPPDVPTAFAGAQAVFLGTVVSIESDTSGGFTSYEVELSVTESWKGIVGPEVQVRTSSSSAACGFDFRVGVSYLVYAYVWPGTDTRLYVHLCTRTHAAFEGDPDIPLLGTPSLPTTWGAVKASYR